MSEIFVVDDSVSVRKALEIALKPHGITTRNAVSGEDALSKLDDAPFDLMIADIIMPGMSGFELCQQVKASPQYAQIPVLLISGNVDEDVRRRAQEVGAEDILRKPFRPDELLPIVQRFLALSAERKSAAPEPASAPDLAQPVASALYDASGQLLKSSGVALPEHTLSYARFYLNTSQALSARLGSGPIESVRMEFAGQLLTFSVKDEQIHIEVFLK